MMMHQVFIKLQNPKKKKRCHKSKKHHIKTIKPGTLKVGVTGICTDDSPHHKCWVYKILSRFAKKYHLKLKIVIVPFYKSWEAAANNQLDVVATGITPLPERAVEGADQ